MWLWVALTRTALHCNEVGNLIVLPHSRKWLSQPLTESYSKTYTYWVSWGPKVTWFTNMVPTNMLHCNKVRNLIVLPHSRKWLSQPLTESYSRTYTYGVSWGPTVTWFSQTWFPLMLHCNKVGNLIVIPHSRKWLSKPLTESYNGTYTLIWRCHVRFFRVWTWKKYRVSLKQFETKLFIRLPIRVGRTQNFEDIEDFEDLDYFEVYVLIESTDFIEIIKLEWSKIDSCWNEYSVS